jgi:L-asparaginase
MRQEGFALVQGEIRRHSEEMTSKSIRIIVTGGTFDKAYDEIKGELTFKVSNLPEILKLARVTVPVAIEQNQLIDSLQMQDENRHSVLDACARAVEERIVVTHGTDTMAETACLIGPAGLAKTIVITGAMVPYQVQGSDALFNFGTAFAAVQLLPIGVYISMSGRIFAWDRVRKDRARGIFEES